MSRHRLWQVKETWLSQKSQKRVSLRYTTLTNTETKAVYIDTCEKICYGAGNESADKGKMSSKYNPIDGRKKLIFVKDIHI